MDAPFDVLVVGAGCAGMRAAIEAFDTGADVARRLEAPPDAQPLRRGRGRHQRGARQHGRGQPGDARLRHRQGLRLPRRPGRDRDLHARGARRHLPARALGLRLLAQRRGQARPAPVRRRRLAAHRLRGRHHRPRAHPRALRAADEAHGPGTGRATRSTSRGGSSSEDGRCVGRRLLGPAERRPEARHRRRRSILATGGIGRLYRATTNAYACTGDGMAMALRAGLPLKDMEFMQFHPTTLYPSGDPDHRGLPRRGRLPDQQRRRALHEALRAERARARLARRRLPRRRRPRSRRAAASTAPCCSTCATSAPEKILTQLPGLARARDDVRRRRPDLRRRSRSGPAPTTTWAASRPTTGGAPSSTASTPPARSPASPCTARTGSAATR